MVHAVRPVRRDLDVVDGRRARALGALHDEADGRQAVAERLRIRRGPGQVGGDPGVGELHASALSSTRGRGSGRRSRRRGGGPARRRAGTRCGRCPCRTRSPSTSRGRSRRSGGRSGCTIPAPMISIQPEPEHGRQRRAVRVSPVPLQNTHDTATSTPGSTNGKNVGPNRIFVSGVKRRREKAASVPLRSANVTPSSTVRPSIWWKTGEWRGSMSSFR